MKKTRTIIPVIILSIISFLPEVYAQETDHWETIIFPYYFWHYSLGSEEISASWKDPGYDVSDWETGNGGIGYGDGDDNTTIPKTVSLFMRLDFNIIDVSVITQAILHADYDDGFVAYLNGTEIARSNIGTQGVPPAWNETTPGYHEAQGYQGGVPEAFPLSPGLLNLLNNGSNTLAVQVHNQDVNSSDLSSLFHFSVGISNSETYYHDTPEWFQKPFESSNLPVMMIETNGQNIISGDRIIANMGLMDYTQLGSRNFLSYPFNLYNGRISIKIRGASSQMFPKKNYSFETQDEAGENNNISLLGLPKENDWVLHGPYSDKTLIRNVLSYHIASLTGRYAPRTRWIELFINGTYHGVYVLTEKIKQDDNRVDIARLYPEDTIGDQLTGGYIIQADRDNNDGWFSRFRSNVFYVYHDPDYDELVQAQRDYIRSFIERFENTAMYQDESELVSWVDISSFVDYWIATEVYNHVDGYKLSFYMYKDLDSKGGKLQFGPVWDLNLAYGNSDFGPEPIPEGWTWTRSENSSIRAFWVYDLVHAEIIQNSIACRWQELRAGPLQTDSLMNFISENLEYIEEARIRNFERWPVLGVYVWPNYYVGADYQDEVTYLTEWLEDRLAWMDENMLGYCAPLNTETPDRKLPDINVFPNPFIEQVSFSIPDIEGPVRIEIYNTSAILQRTVDVNDNSGYRIYLGDLESGLYFYKVISDGAVVGSGKLIKR